MTIQKALILGPLTLLIGWMFIGLIIFIIGFCKHSDIRKHPQEAAMLAMMCIILGPMCYDLAKGKSR